MGEQTRYEVVLVPQAEGGFAVSVPDLPDVVTEGETKEEALEMARDAIEGYLEVIRERGWPIRQGLREHVAVHSAAEAMSRDPRRSLRQFSVARLPPL